MKREVYGWIVCLGLLWATPGWAQKVVSGQVLDAAADTPVPYVAIRAGLSGGVLSDSTGHFRLSLPSRATELSVDLLGYIPQKIRLDTIADLNNLVIRMQASSVNLGNIKISPPKRKKREIDTLALYVLARIQEHKALNNPQNMDSYRLKEHTKLVLSLQNVSPKLLNGKLLRPFHFFFDTPDTNADGRLRYPLLIQEELNETFHRASPRLDRKEIRYRKISGLKGKYLANLAADQFKNLDIYDNVYAIGQLAFTSPFASSARAMYAYYIMDTLHGPGGTSYELGFVGKTKADVALIGYAQVDSATWGIRSIRFKPNEKANINYITDYSVQQNYAYVDGHWLLTEERLSVNANVFENKEKLSVHIGKYSLRDSVQTGITMPDPVERAKDDLFRDAFNKPRSYVDSLRMLPLSASEAHIYFAFDSVKTVPAYKRLKWAGHLLSTGYLKAGPVEFGRVDELVSRNAVEGYRVKLGIRSNEMLSNKVFLNSHFAYSTAIRKPNFSMEVTLRLTGKNERWHSFTFIDKYDMLLLGREGAQFGFDHLFTLLTPTAKLNRVLAYSQNGFMYELDWFRDFSGIFGIARTRYYSVPGKYTFTDGEGNPYPKSEDRVYGKGAFGVTEMSVSLRYSKNTQYIERYGKRRFVASNRPVFTFGYTLGVKGLLGGDYTYNKFELGINQKLLMPLAGYADIRFKAGYMSGHVPFTAAFTAPGNTGFVKDDNSFELTRPFEFQHTKYLMLFYEHHFQGLLFNHIPYVSRAKLREFISVKALYGSYGKQDTKLPAQFPETHKNTPLPYLELGVGVENILKIFRISFHCRTTYWNTPGAENFAVKVGIRPGF